MFEVTVSSQVAFTRIDGGGTRRVRCADGTVHMFSRFPTRFEVVPPEVAADPHLVVRAPAEAAAAVEPPAHGHETPPAGKKGDRVQISTVPLVDGVPIVDVDLDGFDYAALVKLAKDLEIPVFGKKKDDLREELRAHIVANYVADPDAISTTPPASEA